MTPVLYCGGVSIQGGSTRKLFGKKYYKVVTARGHSVRLLNNILLLVKAFLVVLNWRRIYQ